MQIRKLKVWNVNDAFFVSNITIQLDKIIIKLDVNGLESMHNYIDSVITG